MLPSQRVVIWQAFRFAPNNRPLESGSRLRDLRPTTLLLFHQFGLIRHHAPTASQIELRSSKHGIGRLSGITSALVSPLPIFVSTVQHHGGSWHKADITTVRIHVCFWG
jgi:hypothetical protein